MKVPTIRYSLFVRVSTGGCRVARTDPWCRFAAVGIAAAAGSIGRHMIVVVARAAAARIAADAPRAAVVPADHLPPRGAGRPAPPCGAAVSPSPVWERLPAAVRAP